jgi:probable H4MPT-linked C1 transfer pathway protein
VERLLSRELVYTGARRTPVAAVLSSVILSGTICPVAAELFATTLDAHLLLDNIEESGDCDTANGQPAWKDNAHDRLARMICCDRFECDLAMAKEIARQIGDRQLALIADAIKQVASKLPASPGSIVISGSGEFLARQALARTGLDMTSIAVSSLSNILGRPHSASACAFALARLAQERVAIEHFDRTTDDGRI